jgi:5-methylcytosine-specific restriction endonuclease McrA
MTERPPIPADLKRKVLVEAGHRCAIPTCRSLNVDIHHIILGETCKEHKYENLIAICPNCHRRAHKGEIDRISLRLYKNNLRFLYDKFTTFEIDILFELKNIPADKAMQFHHI